MYRVYRGFLFCLLMAVTSGVSPAQSFVLDLPLPSQRAKVSQRIGITDITIDYHRPLVNDRKIWGGLVPYGTVWRAGANENTTITFSDPVLIEGKPLDKGTYKTLWKIEGSNCVYRYQSTESRFK